MKLVIVNKVRKLPIVTIVFFSHSKIILTFLAGTGNRLWYAKFHEIYSERNKINNLLPSTV